MSVVEGRNVFCDALLDLGEVGTHNFVLPFSFLKKVNTQHLPGKARSAACMSGRPPSGSSGIRAG